MRHSAWVALVGALIGAKAQAAEPPRLVVQITFDQLRGDLLERYRPALSGGLKRVLDQGWWVQQGEAAHGITVSWPGHGTLATGLFPSHHGLTANEWWMEVDGRWREVGAGTDRHFHELGADDRPGRSVANMTATSIGDWFKAASPRSKVVAIGSDAAVPYAGRSPDALFWFDGAAGGFTTSTNYAAARPAWVERLNGQIAALPRTWDFSLSEQFKPLAEHPQQCPRWRPVGPLPHNFRSQASSNGADFLDWVSSAPLADELLLKQGAEIVRANQLGADDVPDYLNIAVGSTDSVGHEFGPVSPEQLDTVARLDRALGIFLDDLDRTIGKDRYVIAISADHGATDPPEERCLHRVTSAEIDALLDRVEAIARRHRGSRSSLVAAMVAELERAPFIGDVYTPGRLARRDDWKTLLMKRSFRPGHIPNFPLWSDKPRQFHPARYGIFVLFKEGMIFDSARSVHGSPYPPDRLVPVIFYGGAIPHEVKRAGARTVDVAPTLAALAGVPTPPRLDGRILIAPGGQDAVAERGR